jgi:hypothetical protein
MSNYINNTKWIILVLLFIILNFILLGLVNYIVDPFRVFGSNILPYQVQMNERFVKIEYLKKNNHKYNAYLFGSSRIGTTNPKIIEQYIPQSRFYNFTLSSANLYDYEIHLEFFLKKKYEINTLYLQLDLDDMSAYGHNEFTYSYKLHPEVNDVSISRYYMDYLFGFFPLNISSKIMNNINHKKTKCYQRDLGTWTLDNNEAYLVENCTEYVKQVSSFNFKNRRTQHYTTADRSMKSLKKIVELCNKHNIKLYVFTTPHNQNKMDTFILSDYNNYLTDISSITDFYDFTGYNPVTENNCNYYEMSHYRPHVGELIAGKIFNDKNINIPNNFGKYIKKGSIYDKK